MKFFVTPSRPLTTMTKASSTTPMSIRSWRFSARNWTRSKYGHWSRRWTKAIRENWILENSASWQLVSWRWRTKVRLSSANWRKPSVSMIGRAKDTWPFRSYAASLRSWMTSSAIRIWTWLSRKSIPMALERWTLTVSGFPGLLRRSSRILKSF